MQAAAFGRAGHEGSGARWGLRFSVRPVDGLWTRLHVQLGQVFSSQRLEGEPAVVVDGEACRAVLGQGHACLLYTSAVEEEEEEDVEEPATVKAIEGEVEGDEAPAPKKRVKKVVKTTA